MFLTVSKTNCQFSSYIVFVFFEILGNLAYANLISAKTHFGEKVTNLEKHDDIYE